MSEVHRTEDQVEVELDQKEEINLLDELGGPQGIADSSIPGLVFVIAYTVSGQKLELAAGVAVGIALLIALIRLVRGERARYAASGFFGVALAAFIATRTGKAEDFFLPGLLFNAGYSLAYAISVAIRWPLMGVFIGPLIGEGMTWREDPERVKLFNKISWLWVGTFLLRLAVQLPLYLSGALVALGIAKTAMGLPIFALAIYLSYLMLKAAGIDLQQKKEAEEAG
ncbi:MAG TPA: DUF3159 domain-containing protein [Solirubrobacterales bacterium]|nr:DUF3159 domain-containing protein [Solirubrobacterales bacterium]